MLIRPAPDGLLRAWTGASARRGTTDRSCGRPWLNRRMLSRSPACLRTGTGWPSGLVLPTVELLYAGMGATLDVRPEYPRIAGDGDAGDLGCDVAIDPDRCISSTTKPKPRFNALKRHVAVEGRAGHNKEENP